MTVIPRKACMECRRLVYTYAETPRCIECTAECCDCRYDPLARVKCNSAFDLVTRGSLKVCVSHYKHLQRYCKTCGEPRPKGNSKLSFDNWYYCKVHRPHVNTQKAVVIHAIGNYLYPDVLQKIISLL